MPRIALIGAGRTAAHLGLALAGIGRPVVALGARAAERAAFLAQALGLSVLSPAAAAQAADWVFLCVRDAEIAPLCAALPWRPGQLVLHCSGATELAALAAARAAGARVAGFHPLQLMANPRPTAPEATQAFAGVRIGIEADADTSAALGELAAALGAQPLHLQSGQRARYHAAANAAASALLAPLQLATRQAAQALGCTEEQAWAALALWPKAPCARPRPRSERGAVRADGARGCRGPACAFAGPGQGPDAGLYRALMLALLPLAAERLDAQGLRALRECLIRA